MIETGTEGTQTHKYINNNKYNNLKTMFSTNFIQDSTKQNYKHMLLLVLHLL